MPQIQQTQVVPYTCQQMYDLVNNVQAYPEFLPWCQTSHIIEENREHMLATLVVAKGPIQHAFTTDNALSPCHRIDIKLHEGPFRFLKGAWEFEEVDNKQCRVKLTLSFEFASKMLALALGAFFKEATSKMVQAFSQRARVVYG